jgi:site-specific DNA recombinase
MVKIITINVKIIKEVIDMDDIQALFSFRKKRQGKVNIENTINNNERKRDVYGVLIRVSTDRQAEEGDSIQMQQERAMEIINKNNGILYKYYIEEGISASKNRIKDRPQLQELLEDVQAGIVNKIIAYKRDRLTRITQDWLYILEVCAKAKCDIIFSSSGEAQLFNDPIYGKVFESILASIAEMESANTSMRVRDTMASIAAKGEWTGGILPYGYRRNEYGQIELIKECVPIIKEIEDLYLAGYGIYSIAKWLNGGEVNNLGKRPNGAAPKLTFYKNNVPHWTPTIIETILFNPFYAGIIEYSVEGLRYKQKDDDKIIRVKGDFEPCRTLERQKQIYQMRERKSINPPRTYNTTFLLTGLIYCGVCGSPYQSRNSTNRGKRYSYYTCASRQNKDRNIIHRYCNNVTYKKEILENCIIDEIKKRLNNLDMLKIEEEITKGLLKGKDNIENQLIAVTKELQELEKEEASLLKLMKRLDENNPNYDLLLQRYEEDYAEILKKINNLKKAKFELEQKNNEHFEEFEMRKKVVEQIKNFAKSIDTAPDYLKKSLLSEIIERIDIYPDGKADVTFAINIEANELNTTESEILEEATNDSSDDEFIIYDIRGEAIDTKIIKTISLNITVPTIITIDINKWKAEINRRIREAFPKWLRKIVGENTTSVQFYLDTRMSPETFCNYLEGKICPTEKSFMKIANVYNTTVEDFLEFARLSINKEVLFDRAIHRAKEL